MRAHPVDAGGVLGNLERVPSVGAHPDAEREEKAREIAAYMGKPLEIHDLGIRPLEEVLVPWMEEDGDGAVRMDR